MEAERQKQPCTTSPLCTLLHLAFVFYCIFLGFNAAETLQTSLYAHGGLGLISVALLYIGYFLTALLLAPLVVRRLTPKWSLFVSFFFYVLFIVSNYYPTWWTVITSAGLLGPWSSIAWVACGVYITELALLDSRHSGRELGVSLARYNSIFFVIFTSVNMVGNALSGVVLSAYTSSSNNDSNITNLYKPEVYNTTESVEYLSEIPGTAEPMKKVCGAKYCAYKDTHVDQIIKPDQTLVVILTTAFLAIMTVGIVASFFLRQLDLKPKRSPNGNGCEKAFDALKLMRNPRLVCLLPVLSLHGLFKGFALGVFTQAHISCSLGVEWVGYVMLARGASAIVACVIPGLLAKHIHRTVLYSVTLLLLTVCAFGWLFWAPDPSQKAVFFTLSAIEGIGSSTIRVLNGALIGSIFVNDKEAAFAHFTLWGALINSLIYVSGKFMCVTQQLYVTLVILAFAAIGYFTVESLIARERNI